MNTARIENSFSWLARPVAVKMLVFAALAAAVSAVFFRHFWTNLPGMLTPGFIFGQYQAGPWGVLALCLLFLGLKRKVVWAEMSRVTRPAYILAGLAMLAGAVLIPFSQEFLVFQVLLAFAGLFCAIFGAAIKVPAVCLGIYGMAIFFPWAVERFADAAYSRTAIVPVLGLMNALGYVFQNQGQLVEFMSRGGESISVTVSAACAGPVTMGVFMALFALMTLDMPLSPKRAAWTFLFGVVGTWLQSLIRLVILLLVGYYMGESALWKAHFWTIYILFPLWFLLFAWVYLRQVKQPRTRWGSQQPLNMSAVGGG